MKTRKYMYGGEVDAVKGIKTFKQIHNDTSVEVLVGVGGNPITKFVDRDEFVAIVNRGAIGWMKKDSIRWKK